MHTHLAVIFHVRQQHIKMIERYPLRSGCCKTLETIRTVRLRASPAALQPARERQLAETAERLQRKSSGMAHVRM